MPDSITETLDKTEFGSLTLVQVSGGYQASLHVGGNSFRVRIAPRPGEALREVLMLDQGASVPPCPIPPVPPCPVPAR